MKYRIVKSITNCVARVAPAAATRYHRTRAYHPLVSKDRRNFSKSIDAHCFFPLTCLERPPKFFKVPRRALLPSSASSILFYSLVFPFLGLSSFSPFFFFFSPSYPTRALLFTVVPIPLIFIFSYTSLLYLPFSSS